VSEDVKKMMNDTNVMVQHQNQKANIQLSPKYAEKGVIFTDIHTAIKEHSELFQKHFMKTVVDITENKLTALHVALINNGTFLYVPKNVELEAPLQSVFVIDEKQANLYSHVLIVVEDNSSLTYVENYISTEEAQGVANIVAEVIVGQNSRVSFGAVDTMSSGITTYVNRRGNVARDGKLEWALGCMNDGDTISDNVTNLIGDGAMGDTKLVTIGRGEQKQNFTTNITHIGKRSEGYILKHGVQKDNATSIFNGIGKIEHGASKSNAEQTSRVLMLNEKARGDANPILLIDENDVTAGHAASVGRVDPTQLYYLMSRGIPKSEAERLVIHGFLAPVVNELMIEKVRDQLVEIIERKVRK
jgi:Fe-S cluster assembly protein SufD